MIGNLIGVEGVEQLVHLIPDAAQLHLDLGQIRRFQDPERLAAPLRVLAQQQLQLQDAAALDGERQVRAVEYRDQIAICKAALSGREKTSRKPTVTVVFVLYRDVVRRGQFPPEHPLHHQHQLVVRYRLVVDGDSSDVVPQLDLNY